MKKMSLSKFSDEIVDIIPLLIKGMLKGISRKKNDPISQGKISLPQYITLEMLVRQSGLKMKDIAENLNVSYPAATGIIDRLHKMGMVKRVSDKKDRRVVYIEVTEKGEKIVEEVRKNRHELIERVFGNLSQEERMAYLQIIKKVLKIMNPEEA